MSSVEDNATCRQSMILKAIAERIWNTIRKNNGLFKQLAKKIYLNCVPKQSLFFSFINEIIVAAEVVELSDADKLESIDP